MDTDSTDGKAPDPKPDKPEPFPKEITLKYDVTPINNLTRSINEHKDSQKEGDDGPDSIWNRQIDVQAKGNKITMAGVIVSAVLAALTIYALVLSDRAVNEASRTADAAFRADSIYLATLELDSTKNAQESDSESVRFQKQFDLNKNSADSQIRTMKGTLAETKREFEIENIPYLQITHPTTDTPKEGKPLTIRFTIENFGNYPAKILDYRMMAGVYNSPITDQEIKEYDDGFTSKSKDTFLMNTYVIKESPVKSKYGDTVALTNGQIATVNLFKEKTYFIGYFRYQDLVTKKQRVYRFSVEMDCTPGNGETFRYNDNRPLSAKEAKKPIHLENWK